MEKIKKNKINKKTSPKKTATFSDLKGNKIEKKDKGISKKFNLKEHFKRYKKIYLLILLTLILVAAVIFTYIGIRNYLISKKYGEYEFKMDNYGFSLMYNNQSSKSYEKVTRIEMVKLILSSVYNTSSITNKGYISNGEFEGDEWRDLAVAIRND